MTRGAVPLAALVACCACLACEPATASRPLAAEYALREMNGKAPPVVLGSSATFDGAGTETITLLAATYHFDGRGGARYLFTLRNVSTSPARDTTFTTTVPMTYWRAGDRIEIGSARPCPLAALCAGNAVGRVVGDRLEFTLGTLRQSRRVYEAVVGAR